MASLSELGDVTVESLLDVDPDLGFGIPAEDADAARRATAAHSIGLAEGEGEILCDLAERPEISGFFIAEGVMLREVSIDSRAMPELLGPGDVVDPAVEYEGFIPVRVELVALAPTRVLVLGPSFARACARWPTLLGDIERRKSAERQRVAVQGAISHLPRVELRILALLAHLASVWGRVVPEGIVVPFGLTHEMLGRFVGAERPTVTLAVGQLDGDGLLARSEDRGWLLLPGADDALQEALGGSAGVPSVIGRARQVRTSAREARLEARATRAESAQARRRREQLHALPDDPT